ncbi:DUF2798 domain-containing protein [Acidovorax cavernicola]|nr:DUF2798 domain-containing protein [Acidovorax cavernicola]
MPSRSPNAVSGSRPSLRAILPDLVLLPSIALLLSCIMTWAQVGFTPEFLARWGRGFLTTLVVLPCILACLGAVEKLVDQVIGGLHWAARKLVVAVVSACIFETVIALAVTAVGHPLDASFAGNWWLAFSRSLPAGLLIGLFMCFYMKPRMDRMRQAARARQPVARRLNRRARDGGQRRLPSGGAAHSTRRLMAWAARVSMLVS